MSNNISIKTDLLKLQGATRMDINGKNGPVKCLVIPIELANLYDGEKGVYLDQTAIPLTNPREGSKDTHLVKQSFGKEKFAAMSEDEKKAIPIMGNAIVWGESGSTGTAKSETKSTTPPAWL